MEIVEELKNIVFDFDALSFLEIFWWIWQELPKKCGVMLHIWFIS